MSEEEEFAVEMLIAKAEQAEALVKEMRAKFEKILTLTHESRDSYYTLKIIQKMAEETVRLEHQKEFKP